MGDYKPVDFDLIVVGGGPVGVSLALGGHGLSVAVVADERAPASVNATVNEGLDARVYALSPGNVAFLRSLGVWDRIPADRLQPVRGMQVFGDAGAELLFDAYRAGVPELAWIVEDSVLQRALWDAVERRDDIRVHVGGRCAGLEVSEQAATLKRMDGVELSARLVAGADGATSFVREQAGIRVVRGDYGQEAIVANFSCELPHRGIARQWFQRGPVLALLPLPRQHVSMVWSLPSEQVESVLELDPPAFCRTVEEACGRVLGALSLATAPRHYRLRRISAQRMVSPRIALVGDAAHVIHPLAGQGLNLGLQDVRSLVHVLAFREAVRDAGDLRLLRRYERERAEPVVSMHSAVDGLFRLFGAQAASAVRLRNAGLNLTERLPVVKNLLMRRAMS
jgi:2-polyprenylphenol 6-hydroxylase